jgi:hypothetical protein
MSRVSLFRGRFLCENVPAFCTLGALPLQARPVAAALACVPLNWFICCHIIRIACGVGRGVVVFFFVSDKFIIILARLPGLHSRCVFLSSDRF